MLNNIYEQSKDLHIRNVVIFAKSDDSKLYKDATYTTQVTEDELQELFAKRILLIKIDEGDFAIPVHVVDNKAYVVSASTTAAVTEWTAKASE